MTDKFCVDCKWFKAGPFKDTPAVLATCGHPESRGSVDPVSGERPQLPCNIIRSRVAGCIDGRLWESKYGPSE